MINALPLPLLLVCGALTQSPPYPADLQRLAQDGPDSVLVDRARQRPDDAREALRRLLVETAGGASVAPAERLAAAYAVAWRDSFFVRGSQDRAPTRRSRVISARAGGLRDRRGHTGGRAADQNTLGLFPQELEDLAGPPLAFEAPLSINRPPGRPDPAATNLVNLAN